MVMSDIAGCYSKSILYYSEVSIDICLLDLLVDQINFKNALVDFILVLCQWS